jgi:acetyl esterase
MLRRTRATPVSVPSLPLHHPVPLTPGRDRPSRGTTAGRRGSSRRPGAPDRRAWLFGALAGSVGAAPVSRPAPPWAGTRLRRFVQGGTAPGVSTRDLLVPGTDSDVPVRLYLPPGPGPVEGRPLVVAFPDGGWAAGAPGATAWLSSRVAARVGAVVAEVHHRTAPEHPAPAAFLDAYAATSWLAEHAERLGGRSDRIGLIGGGAGGGLAAAVALDARDRGRPAVAFQALVCPATDLTLASPSIAEHTRAPFLSGSDVRRSVARYLGDLADPRDPSFSPLLAEDHRDLPPALVLTASHDPLRDDGVRYVQALRTAGVPTEHAEVPGSCHGFFTAAGLCPRTAGAALDVVVASLRRALG